MIFKQKSTVHNGYWLQYMEVVVFLGHNQNTLALTWLTSIERTKTLSIFPFLNIIDFIKHVPNLFICRKNWMWTTSQAIDKIYITKERESVTRGQGSMPPIFERTQHLSVLLRSNIGHYRSCKKTWILLENCLGFHGTKIFFYNNNKVTEAHKSWNMLKIISNMIQENWFQTSNILNLKYMIYIDIFGYFSEIFTTEITTKWGKRIPLKGNK